MIQVVRLGVLGLFVLGMPLLAVFTASISASNTSASNDSSPVHSAAPTSSAGGGVELQASHKPPPENPPSGTVRLPAVEPSPDEPFPSPADQDAATKLQEALASHGATEFTLEFDPNSQSFIASCQVPLPTANNLTKAFHSQDVMPLTAMRAVLQQLQQWQQQVARAQATRVR